MDHKIQSTIDDYVVHHTLGMGSTSKVKLIFDTVTHQFFAAKIITITPEFSPHYYRSLLLTEVCALRKISHKNIVKAFSYKEISSYISKSKGVYKCMYILLEYCSNGEIFELLKKNGSLTAEISLFYFRQIIEVLQHCNEKGLVHGDLKPENLMIDNNFDLKIIDFGNSIRLNNKSSDFLGTEQYLPPEVRLNLKIDGIKAELFVAGVILFIMYVGCPPFSKACLEDKLYAMIASKDTHSFWAFFQQRRPMKAFDTDFKLLIEGLLEFQPQNRLGYQQIFENRWFAMEIHTEKVLQDLSLLVGSV